MGWLGDEPLAGRPTLEKVRIRAGVALGVLFLAGPFSDLGDESLTTIRAVALGIGAALFVAIAAAIAEGESPLTAREHDVLLAAMRHDTAAAIAAALHLSEGTVRNYLSAAIQKLGARNRSEAISHAVEKGWL